jgi:hypothetical protein
MCYSGICCVRGGQCATCSNSAGGDGACSSCNVGYRLNNITTMCEACARLNCDSCDASRDVCAVCAPGFTVVAGVCKLPCGLQLQLGVPQLCDVERLGQQCCGAPSDPGFQTCTSRNATCPSPRDAAAVSPAYPVCLSGALYDPAACELAEATLCRTSVYASRYCAGCVGTDGSINGTGGCGAAVTRAVAALCLPVPGVLCGDGACGVGMKCCGAFGDASPVCSPVDGTCPPVSSGGRQCGYMTCNGAQHCCQGAGSGARFCALDTSYACTVPVSSLPDGATCFSSTQCASFSRAFRGRAAPQP